MAPHRKPSGETPSSPHLAPHTVAETLRLAQPPVEEKGGAEEKVSVFWRVFGGTVLSIVALFVVTVYQHVSGALSELRAGHAHLAEMHGDMVKKEDLNQRLGTVWSGLKEVSAEYPTLKAKASQLDVQVRTLEQERKELQDRLQVLGERVARLEALRASIAPSRPGSSSPPRMETIEE